MRILYVCNDYAYFQAHRRWLADYAAQRGHDVVVAAGATDAPEVEPLKLQRHRFDVFGDLAFAWRIRSLARQRKADVVHLITLKPVLFGTLALRFSGDARVVATFPGLGRVFAPGESGLASRLRRRLVVSALRFGFSRANTIAVFESESDRRLLIAEKVTDETRSVLTAGSGVDRALFPFAPLPEGPLRLLFAARLLRAKGVEHVLEAAQIAQRQGDPVHYVVAGPEQNNDPDGVPVGRLREAAKGGALSFLGAVPGDRMPELIRSCHGLVLPTTYGEGVPRILIEGAAMGRMAIVSDIPGCRAIAEDGVSGLVLPTTNGAALHAAASRLAGDRALLNRLCAGARARFQTGGFAAADIGERMLALYAR